MKDDEAREFADAKRGLVIAPAGYGKTELIARAVQLAESRQLILTHTHAGVKVLRDRLKKKKVPSARFSVDTIDGWALRYAHAFATASGLGTRTPADVPWPEIRACAIKSLQLRAVQQIVRRSFSGVYVDEYQDCSELQHKLIMGLDGILGCKIVGDPLQGVFDFSKDDQQETFSFYIEDRHLGWSQVQSDFPSLFELKTPWRWKNGNIALGEWLTSIRERIIHEQPLCFADCRLQWRPLPDADSGAQISEQFRACQAAANQAGSVVAIHQWRAQCYKLGKQLGGRYGCLEPLDCRELFDWASKVETASGVCRVRMVIDFAKMCVTKIPPVLSRLEQSFKGDREGGKKRHHSSPLKDAFIEVSKDNAIEPVERALLAVADMSDFTLYRRELWQGMMKGLRDYDPDAGLSLRETVWNARDLGRRIGRPVGRRVLGTTLLVKGLEFAHAVVLDADRLSAKELYVALTRGSESLRVLSKNSTIRA